MNEFEKVILGGNEIWTTSPEIINKDEWIEFYNENIATGPGGCPDGECWIWACHSGTCGWFNQCTGEFQPEAS